jgi:thiol-disulfide isomerase/thioredoxin
MAPTYERVASELEPEIRFLKVDTEAAPELAARYNIRGVPTLILFQNGAEVARQAGAMDAASLRASFAAASCPSIGMHCHDGRKFPEPAVAGLEC